MLGGLLGLFILLVVVLAIPIVLSFELSWRNSITGYITIHWFFGLVRANIPITRLETPNKVTSEPSAKIEQKTSKPTKRRKFYSLIKQRVFRRRVFQYVRDIWRSIRKDDLKFRLRLGLGDPTETGQLWAFVGPIAGMFLNSSAILIEIEPDFLEEVIEVDTSGNVRLIPLQVLLITLGLLLSIPMWRSIKQGFAA